MPLTPKEAEYEAIRHIDGLVLCGDSPRPFRVPPGVRSWDRHQWARENPEQHARLNGPLSVSASMNGVDHSAVLGELRVHLNRQQPAVRELDEQHTDDWLDQIHSDADHASGLAAGFDTRTRRDYLVRIAAAAITAVEQIDRKARLLSAEPSGTVDPRHTIRPPLTL